MWALNIECLNCATFTAGLRSMPNLLPDCFVGMASSTFPCEGQGLGVQPPLGPCWLHALLAGRRPECQSPGPCEAACAPVPAHTLSAPARLEDLCHRQCTCLCRPDPILYPLIPQGGHYASCPGLWISLCLSMSFYLVIAAAQLLISGNRRKSMQRAP